MKILKTVTTMLVLIFLINGISGMAIAGAPPAVPTPTPVPQTPPPSAPSGGGTTYTPEPFHSYTIDLRSSDGATIGSLNGIDYNTVRLHAASSGTVNGQSHSVAIVADLSSQPSGATLDIKISSEGKIPEGMDDLVTVSSAVITGNSPNGWPLKSGMKISFSIPSEQMAAGAEAKCYVVYFDGTNYQFLTASVTGGDNVTTVEATARGVTGTYTVVTPAAPKPTPVPTPEPTAAPTPVPTPAPAPSGIAAIWSSLWVTLFGTFAFGEAMGAVILLFMGRFGR